MALTVVLGPRRSGKSRVAEDLVTAAGAPVVVIAPLTVTDAEMHARVAAHRLRRPPAWTTVETADVVTALRETTPAAAVLVDSLGTWVSETLWSAGALDGQPGSPPKPDTTQLAVDLRAEAGELAEVAAGRAGVTVVVVEEAGWAPVPPDPGTRLWLDALGDAAQALTARADRVLLVVAGRTVELP